MSILDIHNWIAWTILTMSLITSRGRQVSIPQEAYGLVSDPALRFHQKHLNLCFEDERRSYRVGTTWGWVINDLIFIFGWTNPLKQDRERYNANILLINGVDPYAVTKEDYAALPQIQYFHVDIIQTEKCSLIFVNTHNKCVWCDVMWELCKLS